MMAFLPSLVVLEVLVAGGLLLRMMSRPHGALLWVLLAVDLVLIPVTLYAMVAWV